MLIERGFYASEDFYGLPWLLFFSVCVSFAFGQQNLPLEH